MPDVSAPAGVFVNHLGQTITDIARSRRFYEGLLGFKFWWDFQVPGHLASKVLMVPSPCKLTATSSAGPSRPITCCFMISAIASD